MLLIFIASNVVGGKRIAEVILCLVHLSFRSQSELGINEFIEPKEIKRPPGGGGLPQRA